MTAATDGRRASGTAGRGHPASGGAQQPSSPARGVGRCPAGGGGDRSGGDTLELVAPIFETVWDDVDDDPVASEDQAPLVFERFDRAVGEAMPYLERQLEQLRGLEPPADDEDLIDALLDDHETALADGAELVKAAAGGDEAAMAALESDDPLADVDRRARDYGMTVCGGDG